jgi:hypothetical protein
VTHPETRYLFALDLGKLQDPSALTIVEKAWLQHRDTGQAHPEILPFYTVGFLHRFALGTPYVRIVTETAQAAERDQYRYPTLCIDQTGVGEPIVELFRKTRYLQARVQPILITGGHQVTQDQRGVWHVPKRQLVTATVALMEKGRLKFGRIPDRDLLINELALFQEKIRSADTASFEAWRSRDHDDLTLALCLACWYGEHGRSDPVQLPEPHEIRDLGKRLSYFERIRSNGLPPVEHPDRNRSAFDEDSDVDYRSRRGHFGWGRSGMGGFGSHHGFGNGFDGTTY